MEATFELVMIRKTSRTGRESHPTSELAHPAFDGPDERQERRQSWIHHVIDKQVVFQLHCHAASR